MDARGSREAPRSDDSPVADSDPHWKRTSSREGGGAGAVSPLPTQQAGASGARRRAATGLSPLLGALVRLGAIVMVAWALGVGLNLLRAKPLPLVYEPPARRLLKEAALGPGATAPAVRMISAADVRGVLGREDVAILDSRPLVFHRMGHIPGAVSLPWDRFAQEYPKLRERLTSGRLAAVVVYCSGGDCEDSARLTKLLAAEGVGPLAIYEGGWEEWSAPEPGAASP